MPSRRAEFARTIVGAVADKLGVDRRIPEKYASSRRAAFAGYDDEASAKVVRDLYRADFDIFAYSTDLRVQGR